MKLRSGNLLIQVCGILFAHEQLVNAQDVCSLSRQLVEISCGTTPATAPVAAPVSAPVTTPTNCEGPYPGFAECEYRIQWLMANWNAVEWSQVYIDAGVDGARCSVQRYLNIFDEGGPWCPSNNVSQPVTAPITTPMTAPMSSENCEGPYNEEMYPECEMKIQWMLANWDTQEWSQEYIDGGVDGSRCSIQRFLNLFDQGAPHCPWEDLEANPMSIPADYNLVWNDEFDTDGLVDEVKWKYDTFRNPVGWYNNELQYYSSRRPENAVVDDGKLLIIARIETLDNQPDYGGQKYTSARIITQDRQAWTYGYFDIRAKLPCGGGTWPAIWTLGTTRGEWPLNGEIDIMEFVGNDPNWVQGFVHTPSGYAGNGQGRKTILEDACQDFHNFQMLWTEDKLEFAVDGKKYYEYVNQGTGPEQWPFDAPQYLLLNNAIGGVLGGVVDDSIFPVTYAVDYVRVYQKRAAASSARFTSRKAIKEKKRDINRNLRH